MNNQEIAEVFSNIADLLEIKGEIRFKIRAYQKVARTIEHLPVELGLLYQEGGVERLGSVPGVGEAISKKIEELLTAGRLEYYEKLKSQFPVGIINLMDVPGVGPKTAYLVSKELGISTVEELEQALKNGRVAQLPRMGEKAVENILRHIQTLRTKDRRIPLGVALVVVGDLMAGLRQVPGLHQIAPAGSLRRFRESIGDIDLMGTAENPERVIQALAQLPQVTEVLMQGPKKASVLVQNGLQVDIRIVEDDSFGSLIQHFTGSQQHNVKLRERARRQGLSLSEYGITVIETGEMEKFTTEEAFYDRLGLQYIPPELRQGDDEIDLAERGAIPRLVEAGDIKGDLHAHTTESDGRDSLEAMALEAEARGYQYLAITDHSVGRGIARGLDENRLRAHIANIEELNKRLKGIRILSGSEVDIRSDGTMDYPDELLKELDVVVGSVHSALDQEPEKMMARMIRAMENLNVDIIGHPTGRLLGERQPSRVDMEELFKAALRTGTALEINAQPSRLDLKDIHVRRAKELGIPLVISTDSHSTEQLDNIRLGVAVARRGGAKLSTY
ncbi:MAG: DNA polymerase/3'-5' exonuclease PolX [Dehalococcoidia bacterium]